MRKLIFVFALFAVIFSLSSVSFGRDSNVDTWREPGFNPLSLKKIFVYPVDGSELKAVNKKSSGKLVPDKYKESANLDKWVLDGIISAFKKNRSGRMIAKDYFAVLEDMKFIYGDGNTDDSVFFKRASEMGYDGFVSVGVFQSFEIEHVPEEVRTYTEYKEVEVYDNRGRLKEVLRIPEEKYEVIPAHDVQYLKTDCTARLYSLSDYSGDHKAAVDYSIYREYQGGNVMKVVENIITASMQKMFSK